MTATSASRRTADPHSHRLPATRARLPIGIAIGLGITAVLATGGAAGAATTIDGPVDLGSAASFSVLGGESVTNTGPSVLAGDLGVSPGTSITGFPPGIIGGTQHPTDAVAAQAQADALVAYNTAGSLTPSTSGLADLTGLSLTPGVYSGGALSLSGDLTLAGTAESVWVFQAASTLTIATGARILLTGGASACNVFWRVPSSATIQGGAQFVGTVLASESITAVTGATIEGHLLASNASVTLDTNVITAPTGCAATPGTVTTSPEVQASIPPTGTVGTPYSFPATATGSPAPTYTVTGTLPGGLQIDAATGVISGTPTTVGTFTFTVTASNGAAPDVTTEYTITIAAVAAQPIVSAGTPDAARLPETGFAGGALLWASGVLVLLGGAFVVFRAVSRRRAAGRDRA
ncbi:ice-binding family protein [Plantibacter sp. Mn2098]|uniref:ice-binding family protein n=1 Tax=Plantibacter sp. Mn2098 TaxID=3395266 RepID=UPI003BD8FE45